MRQNLKSRCWSEVWNSERLAVIGDELLALQPYVVLSGGWAWHYLTPPGHVEYKHAHDHKDVELFVAPRNVGPLLALLLSRGYRRAWTRFERLPSDVDFLRYTKTTGSFTLPRRGEPMKVMVDLFIADVPSVESGGFRVLEPHFLLAQYGVRDHCDACLCFAVRIARELVNRNEPIAGHPAMADYERFISV